MTLMSPPRYALDPRRPVSYPPLSCGCVERTCRGLKVSEQRGALCGDVRRLRWVQLVLDYLHSQGIHVHATRRCPEPSSFDERGSAARKRIEYSQTVQGPRGGPEERPELRQKHGRFKGSREKKAPHHAGGRLAHQRCAA